MRPASSSAAPRSRTRGWRTPTGPMPVITSRAGRCPWRTTRLKPEAVFRSICLARNSATSASIAWASRARAPLRRTSVSGSANDPGCSSLTTLASDTAYHSFAGEVEARTPPRYAAFFPSARHQLSPIAHWPFAGPDPPAAMFYYSRDRSGEHPARHLAGYAGILQADAYGGYNKLYQADRKPGPIVEAACWAHARRPFFVLADLAAHARRKAHGKPASVISPLALETVRRIDAIFVIEREINGRSAAERLAVRQARIVPLIAELEAWMRAERVRLSRHAETAKAIDYLLKRWPAFTRLLHAGRICLSNNAAERALRGIALGRKSWLFAGSDRGGQRAAALYSLIVTAKGNNVDPQAW